MAPICYGYFTISSLDIYWKLLYVFYSVEYYVLIYSTELYVKKDKEWSIYLARDQTRAKFETKASKITYKDSEATQSNADTLRPLSNHTATPKTPDVWSNKLTARWLTKSSPHK